MGLPLTPPLGRELDVVGLGQNTLDHFCVVDRFPAPDTKRRLRAYAVQPGGQVATALVALARWGGRTAYLGRFGDDDAGRASRASLVGEGVDVADACVRPGEGNEVSVILVDARTGERTVLWHPSSAPGVDPGALPAARIRAARVLLVDGTDGPAAVAAATVARGAGVPVVADFDAPFASLERLLPLVDVLLVSAELARAVTGAAEPEAALRALRRRDDAVVGVTLGRDGALVAADGATVRAPGHRVDAVDTTGAGDLFHAGFIRGMLEGRDLAATVALANAAAALQCTRLGGRAAIPELAAAYALAGL